MADQTNEQKAAAEQAEKEAKAATEKEAKARKEAEEKADKEAKAANEQATKDALAALKGKGPIGAVNPNVVIASTQPQMDNYLREQKAATTPAEATTATASSVTVSSSAGRRMVMKEVAAEDEDPTLVTVIATGKSKFLVEDKEYQVSPETAAIMIQDGNATLKK